MNLPSRYKPTGVSGGGGMGDIIHCTDVHLNRPVVLKMIKDGEEDRRLLDEQKALIKVRSKHVVQLFDVVTVKNASGNKTALVLEHISGDDLKFESFKANEHYLKTLWQISCGLVEIHREGVIHRDIKPNNIRVDECGVVKILDFGLARPAGVAAQTVSIIGTPGFMAPELWGSATISFDQSIDVYAFGVAALTLITSNVPVELYSPAALGRPQPLPPGKLNPYLAGMPADVISVIEKCLSFNPANRPKMTEVEAVLRRHLLHNRHRALLVLDDKTHEIDAKAPNATARVGTLGAIGVSYDGIRFTISSLTGQVRVNNTALNVGDELPACCVIAFGTGKSRRFVTFDVSNPEVMP